MEKKTTLFSIFFHLQNPRGVFIGTKGKEARGTTPGPKHGRGRARTAVKRGPGRISAALLEPRTIASVPCRLQVLVSCFGPLVFTNQLSKVNGYIIGL